MRKKGSELPENTLSIIIAVLVILLFALAAYKLFTIYNNQESSNAQNAIDVIKGKIDALDVGQNATFLLQGFQQKKYGPWVIAGWSAGNADAPAKCNYKSCICICPYPSGASLTANCQNSNGFCRQLDIPSVQLTGLRSNGILNGPISVPASISQLYLIKTRSNILLTDSDSVINEYIYSLSHNQSPSQQQAIGASDVQNAINLNSNG